MAKPELDVLEAAAVDLDNPIGNRVAKRVGRDVLGIAGPAARKARFGVTL